METSPFKYREYLSDIANCPSENCRPKSVEAYRWVHSVIAENDFKPLSLIKTPPQLFLDDSDLHCMTYGLSLYDSLKNAKDMYLYNYNRQKGSRKEMYKEAKGDCVAIVNLSEEDGVCCEPNSDGYFTFHEFKDVNLLERVSKLFNIFEDA